jgi:hypothetical protein
VTTFSHAEAHQTLRAHLSEINGLPTARAWELVAFTPQPRVPYVEESYVPGAVTQRTFPAAGASIEYTGLYTVRLYGLIAVGPDALHALADTVLAAFLPGAAFTMPSGLVLRIRGDVAPSPAPLIAQKNGFAVCPLTIPWHVFAQRAIAA